MYGIIYRSDNDGRVNAVMNKDGGIRLFDTLNGADREANALEKKRHKKQGDYARVVSLESVNE
jgi:hypothetical protein